MSLPAKQTLAQSTRLPRKVTAQEVAQMLRRAKAPKPCQDPDGCRLIAECMMTSLCPAVDPAHRDAAGTVCDR